VGKKGKRHGDHSNQMDGLAFLMREHERFASAIFLVRFTQEGQGTARLLAIYGWVTVNGFACLETRGPWEASGPWAASKKARQVMRGLIA
jgi:hypothetical protein